MKVIPDTKLYICIFFSVNNHQIQPLIYVI